MSSVAAPGTPRGLRAALRDPVILTCGIVIGMVVAACLAAPLLTSADPIRSATQDILAPYSSAHPLGGDGVGRDVLARLLYGGRSTLLGALIGVAVAIVIGAPAGVIAGFFRGWFDSVAGWVSNLLMAIPGMVILLVVFIAVGNNVYLAMAVFGVLLAPNPFRLIRSSVLAVREELYIDAARVSGIKDRRIIVRHVLPVAVAPLFIQAAQLFAVGIVVQAGLQFLGLGSATEPSWGAMLNDAFANIYTAPRLLIWPAGLIVLTSVLLSLLASAVRDRFQSRGRESRPAAARAKAAGPAQAQSSSAADSLLSVRDVRISYGAAEVVRGVSLDVRRGQVLGIVGETGSGKSQTAYSVLGLLPANAALSSKGVFFDGTNLAALTQKELDHIRGRRIGYVPQEPMSNLDPAFKVGSQLIEPIRRHLGLSRAESRERAINLLERVGIREPERVANCYPHELSGGMAQRVLIAGAVSCHPDLLIADEPTTALDVTVQAQILELLRSLQKESGMAMLLVTHDFGVVADICDSVVVMRHGRIIEAATVDELFARPKHDYTKALLTATLVDAPTRQEMAK
jgi:peptide/nickel transport system permease protein